MRREAPVEEDSSQEQTADNNAAEGTSETSEEGTVSYDENTYSEDTYYNGSNDTSSQEDADIFQIHSKGIVCGKCYDERPVIAKMCFCSHQNRRVRDAVGKF